jgi:regulator of sigma E protease
VVFTVVRNGEEKKITVTPVMADVPDETSQRWRVGIKSDPQEVETLPFGVALRKSLEDNKKSSFLILELVEKMLQRKVSVRQVEGPIGIGRAAGQAARQQGWAPLLTLTAAISLNLGIFNLFPIPILDGGVILMLLIESVMGHDISLRIKERVYQVAFLFLVLFAVMVIYNDLVKTLPGLAQRLP